MFSTPLLDINKRLTNSVLYQAAKTPSKSGCPSVLHQGHQTRRRWGNFRSLNRDLFNSIYHEWNTTIGNVSEVVGNDTDYQSKVKEITNYINELKSYFDNEDRVIY